MPVYDKNTGEKATYIDSEKLTKDISSGLYNFGDQTHINVYRPGQSTKDIYNIPVGNINDAIADGYLIESDKDRIVREYVASDEGQSLSSMAGVLGEEFVDALFMGAPAIYNKYTDDPLEASRRKALSDEHSLSGGIGFAAGTILNIIGTGGLSLGVKAVGKGAVKATEKLLTKRILAAGGKKITEEAAAKGAKVLAKKIAKTVTGTAVLGAAEMTPAALTEMYFGNNERAAELLGMGALLGGGIGATLGIGGAAARGTKDLFQRGVVKVSGSGLVSDGAVKVMSSFSGVPEDVIRYAKANPDAVRNARPINEIASELNAARNAEFKGLEVDQLAKKDADDLLKSNEQAMTSDMKSNANAPSEIMADRIERDIENTKEYFGIMSKEADDSLAEMIPYDIIPRKSLTTSFDNQIRRLSKLPGEADKATHKRLVALKESVVSQYGTHLTGVEARDALRSLRRDVGFGQKMGEFDSTWDKAMKRITRNFSEKIKKTPGAEDYAAVMDDLAPKAGALEAFSKTMKSRTARLNMAKIMSKPNLSASEKVQMEVFEEFLAELDNVSPGIRKDYAELATGQRNANQYMIDEKSLRRSRSKDKQKQFYKKYFPEELDAQIKADDNLVQRKSFMKEMKPAMGGEGAKHIDSNKVNKMMYAEGDEVTDKAMATFFERSNLNYDDIKASSIADQLTKARPAGSKYVNTFGFGGGALGGLPGMLVGAGIGAAVDRYGGAVVREMTTGKMSSWLNAEAFLGKIATKMDSIPKALKKGTVIASRDRIIRVQVKIYRDVIREVPPEDRKKYGISNDTPTPDTITSRPFQLNQWKALTYRFDQYAQNPNTLVSQIEEKTEALSGDPELVVAMSAKLIKDNQYLSTIIPKDPLPPDPFPDEDLWEPSDMELDVFNQKVLVVQDPLSVVDSLLAGDLTRNMTDALEETNPNIMAMIQSKVGETIIEDPKSFDYTKRLSASYLMKVNLVQTATPESYLYYQKVIASGVEPEQEQAQDQASFSAKLNIDPSSLQTSSSRLAGGLSE